MKALFMFSTLISFGMLQTSYGVEPQRMVDLIFFQDTVRSVDDRGERTRVTFHKHAAIYYIEKTDKKEALIKAAKDAINSKSVVYVTVTVDKLSIERLDQTPDPKTPNQVDDRSK
jgi:hypothetical protein